MVEMAGIEPASERLDPRKSTSVAGWACRHRSFSRQTWPAASRSGPKALFRAVSSIMRGTTPLWRPIPSPGAVRDGWTRPQLGDRLFCGSLMQRGAWQR